MWSVVKNTPEKSSNIKPADLQNLHLLFEKGKWGEHPIYGPVIL
jgi:hypothetical protein